MKRPPTASGVPNTSQQQMQSSGDNFSRPHTGPSPPEIKKPFQNSEEHQSFGSSDNLNKVNANNFNFAPRTHVQQSEHSDFERATNAEQSEASYYYEEAPKANSESESEEGFYMPTLIHKTKSVPAKKKKKQKKRKMDSARGSSPPPLIVNQSKKQAQTLSGNDSREMVVANNSLQGNIIFGSTFSNQQALQSLTENQILMLEIEQQKLKTKQLEEQNRLELEKARQQNKVQLERLQQEQQTKIAQI